MAWVATIRVYFNEDTSSEQDAQLLANNCEVALLESQIVANDVNRTETVSVKEQ